MTKPFPIPRIYPNFNAPGRIECQIYDLEVVEGELPVDLRGTFYRMQPDPAWPPMLGSDIPLNGDGMVTKFSFDNGHVDYASKYVHTEKFKAERAARKALFGRYRNPFTNDPSVKGLSGGTANTNLLWFANKLMALKEDSHPIAVDPKTLETFGDHNFNAAIHSETFTAHPKVDPVTGELVAFGYEAKGLSTTDIALYIVSPNGEVTKEVFFQAPYACMVHDFAITPNYVLFPITPLCSSDVETLKQGGPHFQWDGTQPSYLGVIPRNGEAKDVRWYKGPTAFAGHTMNAYEEGSLLHFETTSSDMVVFPFFPDKNGGAWDPSKALPRLERWTVDVNSTDLTFERKLLSPEVVEFPRIDERYASLPYRHAWTVNDAGKNDGGPNSLGGGLSINAIAHFDLKANTFQNWYAGPGVTVQEPQFVPRSADAPEGDGWVLAVANKLNDMHSEILVFDAQRIKDGPIARVRLPIRLRMGLHGIWVGQDASLAFEPNGSGH